MKKIMVGIVVMFAVMALSPVTRVFSACDPEPVIVNELPRMDGGWSGSVAWYNGMIYEVADCCSYANIKNPVTGVTEGQIQFDSWAANDTKGFTYDPFRGTFWCKVGSYAYEVAVTGGGYLSRIPINTGGMAFGIWCDPDEENVMWVADPAQPQIRKVDIRDSSVLEYVNTDFNVRGVSRVGDTLWCTRAGEPGDYGVVIQVDMAGNELCKYYLPAEGYTHDAGGCDIDPDGYLWVMGGKDTAIYQIDIGYVPTTPTPVYVPTPSPVVTPTPAPTSTPLSPIMDSGDYDGDGTSDIAIFRGDYGLWAIRDITRVYFGTDGDIPASGDFNGDGTTDLVIFRKSSGLWAARDISRVYFGGSNDISVPGDYDVDGACDAAIYRPSSGLWAIRGVTRIYFGGSSDIPVPVYGSGRTLPKDIGIFRPSSGLWAIRGLSRAYFGTGGDQPVPANYGTLSETPGIYRASSGLWALKGITRVYFGGSSDQPVPGNYTGFVPADIGIFRPSSGLWAIKGQTRVYYGRDGDIPVSGLSINPSSAALL